MHDQVEGEYIWFREREERGDVVEDSKADVDNIQRATVERPLVQNKRHQRILLWSCTEKHEFY